MGPKGIKPEDQIRKLSKIEANKVCVDCPEKVIYLCLIINDYYYYYYCRCLHMLILLIEHMFVQNAQEYIETYNLKLRGSQ